MEGLNPNSLKVVTTFVEPPLASVKVNNRFQFERREDFVANLVDLAAGRPVFNLAAGVEGQLEEMN